MELHFIIEAAATALIGALVAALWARLSKFADEQRAVNEATRLANRSMQREVIFRYFERIVERGEHVTPEECEHIDSCYRAYRENGGNGTATLMVERIKENIIIDTGRGDQHGHEGD